MGSIVVLTGPPGAGKTTRARMLAAASPTTVHLEGDRFFHAVVGGFVEPWRVEAQRQNEVVHDAMAAACLTFARAGWAVVLDSLHLPWALDRLEANVAGEVALEVVVLRPDLATCLDRVARRGAGLRASGPVRQLHASFADLGRWEANVVAEGT